MNSQRWLFTCLVASSSCHGEQVISTLLAKIHSLDLDPFAGLFGGLTRLDFRSRARKKWPSLARNCVNQLVKDVVHMPSAYEAASQQMSGTSLQTSIFRGHICEEASALVRDRRSPFRSADGIDKRVLLKTVAIRASNQHLNPKTRWCASTHASRH